MHLHGSGFKRPTFGFTTPTHLALSLPGWQVPNVHWLWESGHTFTI